MANHNATESSTNCVHRAYALIAFNHGIAKYEDVIDGTFLPQSINDVPVYLSLSDVLQMVHKIDSMASNRYWSVEFGEKLGTSSHGSIGAAALSAKTVGQAIDTFAQWFKLRCNVYNTSVIHHSGNVEIQVFDSSGDQLFEHIFFQAFSRAIEVMVEQLFGSFGYHDLQILSKQKSSEQDSVLQSFYKSQLIHDSNNNSIKFTNKVWHAINPLADDSMHQIHINDCKTLANNQQQDISIEARVQHFIEQHYSDVLAKRKEANEHPRLIDVCDHVNMTERTLIRHLKRDETSFKKVISEIRQEYAVTLLKGNSTIRDIAELLGYSDVANFCRAFKVWFRETPTDYRKRFL